MLVSRGRLSLPFPPLEWYERLISLPNYATIDLSAQILADSHFLPGTPPGDPMDRIMIATARTHGLRIMTRDARILDYADKGHVLALAC